MSALGQTNRVIFYDQRGCGRSICDINNTSINVKNFIADLDSIRKAFGYKKITILGHSWGGFLAMSYAITHPEAVNTLILLNTMPASSEEFSLFEKEVTERLAPYQMEVEALERTQEFLVGDPLTIEKYYRIYFRTYCYNPAKADLLNLRMTPTAFVNALKVDKIFQQELFRAYSIHDQLKKITASTLIIHGDSDPIPSITARKIHKEIPESSYIELQNCGHFPYVESPEELFRALNEFLQRHSSFGREEG
jgi:proline iminopeptidase